MNSSATVSSSNDLDDRNQPSGITGAERLDLPQNERLKVETQRIASNKSILEETSSSSPKVDSSEISLEALESQLVQGLVESRGYSGAAAHDLVKEQLESLGNKVPPASFNSILGELTRMLTVPKVESVSTRELQDLRHLIAFDVLYELAGPAARIDQGQSQACAVTSREYINQHPEQYARFIADLVTKGYGNVSRTASGLDVGLYSYSAGMLELHNLQSRTLGNALFQSVILKTVGSPEAGVFPADVERFLESFGKPAKIRTSSVEVSEEPESLSTVVSEVFKAAKEGRRALVSLDFADSGAHVKHMLEVCKTDDSVPKGYLKLSNPWNSEIPLPERFKESCIVLGDGRFLIPESELRKAIYFAALESSDEKDFGKTAHIREGQFKPSSGLQMVDMGLGNPLGPQASSSVKAAAQTVLRRESVSPALSRFGFSELETKKNTEPSSGSEGSRYFRRLAGIETSIDFHKPKVS